jgi:hypothetical protein
LRNEVHRLPRRHERRRPDGGLDERFAFGNGAPRNPARICGRGAAERWSNDDGRDPVVRRRHSDAASERTRGNRNTPLDA